MEEYIPDPVGSITFGNLNRRMHEGSLQVLALQESIDALEELDYDKLKEDLRLQLNQMAQMQWMMVQFGQSGTLAYEQMDQAYDAVREQFDAIKDGDMQADNADTVRQLKNLQNQIIIAGEATYIALSAMEIQEDGLERQLAALDRQLEELALRYELGHISSQTLKQAQAGRTALTRPTAGTCMRPPRPSRTPGRSTTTTAATTARPTSPTTAPISSSATPTTPPNTPTTTRYRTSS